MTAQSAIPLKWYVPFAQSDSARVEIPVTSSDATRASQTLGFPPLTMQPAAVGGVPPQGEDFNGAMNQVARVAWWVLNGGGWPYDSTFATNSNIGGYPNGAKLQSADFLGQWISTTDNNQINPDTVGTGWVPGYQYGATAITGQTGGTTTLTPLQAAKRGITVSGTLTSALTLVLPAWIKDWSVTNNTTGAFALIAKTASGSGVTIPQNGAPTPVSGDGTNILQSAQNIAAGTSGTHAMTVAQGAGVVGTARNPFMSVATAAATATFTADEVIVETALGGVRYCLANFSQTINLATTGAGGMDTGAAPVSGYVAVYAIYNPTTGARALLGYNATSATAPEVYSGANMPSGYTASSLVAVWPTNASSQFVVALLRGRTISRLFVTVLNSSTATASLTAVSIASAVPLNAKTVRGTANVTNSVAANANLYLAGDVNGVARKNIGFTANATFSYGSGYSVNLLTPQTMYWASSTSAGTVTVTADITEYDF